MSFYPFIFHSYFYKLSFHTISSGGGLQYDPVLSSFHWSMCLGLFNKIVSSLSMHCPPPQQNLAPTQTADDLKYQKKAKWSKRGQDRILSYLLNLFLALEVKRFLPHKQLSDKCIMSGWQWTFLENQYHFLVGSCFCFY